MWSRFLDHNIRTSLTRPDLILWLNGMCLNSYPHYASPGAACPQTLFLSLRCFALFHKEAPLPPPQPLMTGRPLHSANGRCWRDSGDGREREVRAFLPFFLCLPSSSISPVVPHRPSLLPAPITWPSPGLWAHCSSPGGGAFW